ncbi:MAG TPA: Ig-like domain-containing protein, partial [Streptosporangiaceae bacterium]|nr:Ig-like domain-containing protein [Streptosporangiaceae bacterium]
MKLNLRRVISSAAVLAIAGGVMAAAAGVASAATTPPWEPDPNALGSITFYNSSGQAITGGSNLANLAAYAEASSADTTGANKAELYFAAPTPGEATGLWFSTLASTATVFPNTSAPAPLNTATNPVVALSATDANLTNFIASSAAQTATGYANVYQVRLYTSGAGGIGTLGEGLYWETDILVNPTAGTWSVEYPAVQTATTTTLSASPTTGTAGVAETLTATTTAADGTTQAGTVEFLNGATVIGTDAVNGSGVATQSFTPAAAGTDSLSAVFTPTNTGYSSSTGTLSQTINPAATPTTTSLTVTQDGVAGDDVSLSSTVSPATAPGTVSWYDNGSTTPLNATPVTPNGSGVATFDIPAGLAAGNHSIVADFTPTNPANFEASASAAQSFLLEPKQTGACAQTGSQCTATANIEATVPVGTLVLSTPYTTANPLNLGNLALNAGLTQYSAT